MDSSSGAGAKQRVTLLVNDEEVEIEINLEDTTLIGGGASACLDSQGALHFQGPHSGLDRLASDESVPKKISGGGGHFVPLAGEKLTLGKAGYTEGWSVEVEKGVFWRLCLSPWVLLQIDTNKGEVETLFFPGGRRAEAIKQGPFADDTLVTGPQGPLMHTIGPSGSEVFFFEHNHLRDGVKLMNANLDTKKVKTFDANVPWGVIHDPSSIRPTQKTLETILEPYTSINQPLLASKRLTWITEIHGDTTRLLDLDSGENVALFSINLYPLLALSSSVLLVIEQESEKSLWISSVDWSLPSDLASSDTIVKSSESRYLLPKERIRRIAKLVGSSVSYRHGFPYNPTYNQLYSRHDAADHSTQMIRYSNVITITSTTSTGAHKIGNLAKLLLPECPLPYDLQLEHAASNATWNVHYDVLNLHNGLKKKEDIDRLANVVKYSLLPKGSVAAFLNFLYFGPPADLNDPIEAFMTICHCIQLCNQTKLGSESTNYLLWLLAKKIVPKLSNDVLLQQILTLWLVEQDSSAESTATYSKESPLMSLLALRCREYVTEAEIENAPEKFDFSSLPTHAMPRVGKLLASFSLFLSSRSSVPLIQPELSSKPPSMGSQTIKWDENLSVASQTPPGNKHSYVFTIEGLKEGGIVCNSLFLYPQWRWFERLCKTENCVEVMTRHVVMPVQFTRESLLAILSAPYSAVYPIENLSTADMTTIDTMSAPLHLPEGPCFAKLVKECSTALRSAVNDSNCLEKLLQFWEAGLSWHSPLFVDTIKLVYKNRANISLEALSKLPMRMRLIVGAYIGQNSPSPPENFISFVASIDAHATSLSMDF